MRQLLINLVSLLVIFPCLSYALPSDREQPINIEADHAQIDDKTGITQYKGRAILTQGTLRIEGDIITFYYDENKNLTKAVSEGKLAQYKQIHKENEEPVRAKAVQMEYYAQSQKVFLLGQGQIWQDGDKMTGDRIEYDITNNVASVRSGPVKLGEKVEQSKGRVHIIIQPPSSRKSKSVSPKKSTENKPVDQSATSKTVDSTENYRTATISTHLNVRTGPSTNYKKLGLFSPQQTVIVITEQKTWTQVRGEINGETIIGWVNNRYLIENKNAE